jgi:thiamine-phosphate pyrophosphorylase
MGYDLYVITDTVIGGGRSHEEIARLAIEGGADIIQLRDKAMSTGDLVTTGRRIAAIAKGSGTTFIINDRLDVALACGADGVHLGQDDMSVAAARKIAPAGFLIGVSVGSGLEAQKAVAGGADYIAASPVFPTPSKTDISSFCGLAGLREIRAIVTVPVIAIGGIGLHNIRQVIGTGADGIAVISAAVGQPDIKGAVIALRRAVIGAKREHPNCRHN